MKIAATNKVVNINGETIVNKAYVGSNLVLRSPLRCVDYTAFTESDPGSDITVTPNLIQGTDVDMAENFLVKYDGGSTNRFPMLTPWYISFTFTEMNDKDQSISPFSMSASNLTSPSDGWDWYDILSVYLYYDYINELFYWAVDWFTIGGGPNSVITDPFAATFPYTAYLKMTKIYIPDPEWPSYGFTLDIYDDPTYSNLVDSLTISSYMGADYGYRYLFPLMNISRGADAVATFSVGCLDMGQDI